MVLSLLSNDEFLFELVVFHHRAVLLAVEMIISDVQVPQGQSSAAFAALLTSQMEDATFELARLVGVDGLITHHAAVDLGLEGLAGGRCRGR